MGKKIERQCPICKKTYTADEVRLKHGRQTTCSRKCSYELRTQNLKTSVELECPICGQSFQRTPAQIDRAKYACVCSLECLYKGRSLGIIEREVIDPYEVTDEGREGWIEAGKRRKGQFRKPPIVFTCETCGKPVSIPRHQASPSRKYRFCSNDCASVGLRGDGNPAWRGGYKGYYGPDWEDQRCKARERDGYACQMCGASESELGQELDVHHIIRFNDFTSAEKANHLDNLTSLCHPCHMLREWQDNPRV